MRAEMPRHAVAIIRLQRPDARGADEFAAGPLPPQIWDDQGVVLALQMQFDNHEVKGDGLAEGHGFQAGGRVIHGEPFLGEQETVQVSQMVVVIHNQDSLFGFCFGV